MFFVRQGATHKVVIGPAVAVGDGFTPVTTLDISTADEAEVILHDNGTVVDISGYTFAAITTAAGYYHLTLQSGISNTVGHVTIVINDDSLILPLRADFTVLEEAVYDQMFAASAPGAASQASVDTIDDFLDTEIAAILAAVDTEVASILTDTAEIGAAGAGLTNINLPNQTMDIVGNITGNLSGSVGSVTAGVTLADDAITAAKYDETTAFPLTSADTIGRLRIASGTIGATGNDATHLHLTGLAYADDQINDLLLRFLDVSTGLYYSRWISDFANTGDLATLSSALPVTPEDSVDTYEIFSIRQDVTGGSGLDAAGVRAALGFASASYDTDISGLNTKLDTVDDFLDTEIAAILAAVDTEIAAILADTDAMSTTGVTLANGVTHGGTTAMLRLGSTTSTPALYATNSGGHAARFQSTGGNGSGWRVDGEGTGSGLQCTGGLDGPGIYAYNGTAAPAPAAVNIQANSMNSGVDANAIYVSGDSTAADTLELFAEALDQATGQLDSGSFAAGAIAAAGIANGAIDAATFAADVDAEFRSYVGLASANLDTQLAKLDTIDDFLDTEIAAILAAVDTEIAAILVDTGTDIPATLAGLFTTAMTEGYRATGATGSVRDLLYEILGHLGEHANAGTTRTLKKLDGTTTSKTYTYNDAADPSSITETT